jgi:hypothetical protein
MDAGEPKLQIFLTVSAHRHELDDNLIKTVFRPTKTEPASPARVKYTPSMAIQSLTHGTSASAIARSPNSSDFNTDGPERWPDRFSHLTKDSYGNLR